MDGAALLVEVLLDVLVGMLVEVLELTDVVVYVDV